MIFEIYMLYISRPSIVPVRIRSGVVRVQVPTRTIAVVRVATTTKGHPYITLFQLAFHVSEVAVLMPYLS